MNILIFTDYFGEGYGTGYSIRKEIEQLKKIGHHIIILNQGQKFGPIVNNDVKQYFYNFSRRPVINILLTWFNVNRALKKILALENIDIIYCHTPIFGFAGLGKYKGIPLVYFCRSTILGVEKNKPKEFWFDSIRRMFIVPILICLEKRCLKASAMIFVKSFSMQTELQTLYNIKMEKINIVMGGIDQDDFPTLNGQEIESVRSRYGIKKDQAMILFAGRVMPVKGLIFLLEALVGLVNNNIVLLIAGKSYISNYDKKINKLIADNNLSKSVIFAGQVGQQKMYELYNACDLVVLSSTYEPFGMVNIQAIRYNKKLITTKVTGSTEVISDYPNLLVVDVYNAVDLRKAIEKLLNQSLIKADEYVEKIMSNLSWVNMVNQIDGLFKNIKNEK